jgi:hypothetical protein
MLARIDVGGDVGEGIGLRFDRARARPGPPARRQRGQQRDAVREVLDAALAPERQQRGQQRDHRVLGHVVDVGMPAPEHLAHDAQHAAAQRADQRRGGVRVVVRRAGERQQLVRPRGQRRNDYGQVRVAGQLLR